MADPSDAQAHEQQAPLTTLSVDLGITVYHMLKSKSYHDSESFLLAYPAVKPAVWTHSLEAIIHIQLERDLVRSALMKRTGGCRFLGTYWLKKTAAKLRNALVSRDFNLYQSLHGQIRQTISYFNEITTMWDPIIPDRVNEIQSFEETFREFANDFAKKALSVHPSWAHHAPPSFAHESLNFQLPELCEALVIRDTSLTQDIGLLHKTERERLIVAFDQYEDLCSDAAWIYDFPDLPWLRAPGQTGPYGPPSPCQFERVTAVYYYVRLQYLLMFHALWIEYKNHLNQFSQEADPAARVELLEISQIPLIFRNQQILLQGINRLCSMGLMFLFQVLRMDANKRREALITYSRIVQGSQWFYRSSSIKDLLHRYCGQPAVECVAHSDSLSNIAGPNRAYLRQVTSNVQGKTIVHNTRFCNEKLNNLRRRGYAFWNADRCMALGLDDEDQVASMIKEDPGPFLNGNGFLDSQRRLLGLSQACLELIAGPPQFFSKVAIEKANQLYIGRC